MVQPHRASLAVVAVVIACATVRPGPTTPAPLTADNLPRDWHLLDESGDHLPGISAERAFRELIKGKPPRRTVIVALLDIGVDTEHPAIRPILWTNQREIPGNKIDDDHNGYVDDVHGWNFLGGPDGRNIDASTYEIARLYRECVDSSPSIVRSIGNDCPHIVKAYSEERSKLARQLTTAGLWIDSLGAATRILVTALGTDSLTSAKVEALKTDNTSVVEARRVWLSYLSYGATMAALTDWRNDLRTNDTIGLNPRFDPSPIVRDHPNDPWERYYGNPDVSGRGSHGTLLSGIIAGLPDSGVRGIARSGVRIMAVRASCACDERDKDVANAIRYAVDNGADIISMSFGKGYSPQKIAVDSAVMYADAKGVLMVHGSGNDGADTDTAPDFPNPRYIHGAAARAWIEVGASSWKMGDSLAAFFTNYGHRNVDILAPGVDIFSASLHGQYERASGTSAAAPMVTGIAAVLMEYYPELTAVDVKRIIIASASDHRQQMVIRPGTKNDRVAFGDLSVAGGIANLYAALRMADRETASAQRSRRLNQR